MNGERDYHDVPESQKDVELTRNLSRLSATLHKNGDLNQDREQIQKLAKLLSRYVTRINRSDLERQQLIDINTGKYWCKTCTPIFWVKYFFIKI